MHLRSRSVAPHVGQTRSGWLSCFGGGAAGRGSSSGSRSIEGCGFMMLACPAPSRERMKAWASWRRGSRPSGPVPQASGEVRSASCPESGAPVRPPAPLARGGRGPGPSNRSRSEQGTPPRPEGGPFDEATSETHYSRSTPNFDERRSTGEGDPDRFCRSRSRDYARVWRTRARTSDPTSCRAKETMTATTWYGT